jgi:hypothetical protein
MSTSAWPAVKKQPAPTQPDIARGCIAVRNITFQRSFLRGTLVSGRIENTCGRDAYVDVRVVFFGIRGDEIDEDFPRFLVPAYGLDFRVPLSREAQTGGGLPAYAASGRVTEVYAQFQP